jgi:pyruvate,water dikinase
MNNEQDRPLVLPLADSAATLEQVGGKGASLARMAAAGLPVPPGFHITTAAYRRFVAENGLQDAILAAVQGVAPDQPATLDEAAAQISRLFAANPMPAGIAEAVRRAYAGLCADDPPVAVRSSATAEDLPEMSFAGQQETYLNMRGAAQVLDAVQRCWASLWTARAIGYRARHGIAPQDVSLAVVVQELVPADAAGVLFTANPVTGARDQVMINAAWGLGEAIVGGQVTPDTVLVNKADGSVVEQQINEKDVMTVRTPTGTQEAPVPADQRNQPVLSAAQAGDLARLGERIEDLYGRPMDIEWARNDGQVFVVQARPITALPEPGTAPGDRTAEWQLPNPKGRYMRSSLLELLPDPLTPLFGTMGLAAYNRAMNSFGKKLGLGALLTYDMLTTVNGYGYYDLTMTPAQAAKTTLGMMRFMGGVPRLLRTAETRWQAAHTRYAEVVSRWEATHLPSTPATTLLQGAQVITARAAQYYMTIQSGILPNAYMTETLFSSVYDQFFKRDGDPAALTFMLGFDSAPIRAEKSLYDLAQWVRAQPGLTATLSGMPSEQFAAAYQEDSARTSVANEAWPEFRRRLADHLARFGRAIYDLDFAKPLLVDDPAPVLETLKFFLSGQAPDPHKRQATAQAAREAAMRGIHRGRAGISANVARRLLRTAQRFAPLRENALADAGLGWPVLRRMLRELGGRLVARHSFAAPDDVFWLTLADIQAAAPALDAGHPTADYQPVVAERRATWARRRAFTPPPALPLKGGARFLGVDFTSMLPARSNQPAGSTLKGIAVSPGQVSGPARVIHGPEEFTQMRQGDILVARITTPAWTPLFALAGGVVTDIGGPLSHGSIVAREYHIPAVLGTGTATERLHSGEPIIVDGDAGTVTLAG